MISFAVESSVAASRPWPDVTGESLTRGFEDDSLPSGRAAEVMPRSADLDLGEADDRGAEPMTWVIDCLSSLAYGWSSRATSL